VEDVLDRAGDLAGRLLLTCSLPMSKDDSRLVIGHTSSGAEALAEKVPGARVVSAFGTVPSEVLPPVFAARGRITPPDLVLCGDDARAKKTAAGLIRGVGFNPVDVGALDAARYLEPFALLVAQIAYRPSGHPELAYRFERLRKRSK
jgi:predicted dinucleotide-binding enzyme